VTREWVPEGCQWDGRRGGGEPQKCSNCENLTTFHTHLSNRRDFATRRFGGTVLAMWIFLLGFGAIFAGYAIYIGPLGKKRDSNCGYLLDNMFKLCQKQQDLYYLDGMSILDNFSNESNLLEIERLYTESYVSFHDSEFTTLQPSEANASTLTLYRKIVKDFASQLWKDVAMVPTHTLSFEFIMHLFSSFRKLMSKGFSLFLRTAPSLGIRIWPIGLISTNQTLERSLFH
jgi:hypothetical protein